MLVLPLIPITALVIQNSVNMSTLQGYQTRVSTIRRQVKKVFVFILEEQVRGAMEIALFIQNIQEERAEVALYIFINQVGVEISANPQNPKKFENFCLPDQHGSQAAGQHEPCKQYPRGWFRGQRQHQGDNSLLLGHLASKY